MSVKYDSLKSESAGPGVGMLVLGEPVLSSEDIEPWRGPLTLCASPAYILSHRIAPTKARSVVSRMPVSHQIIHAVAGSLVFAVLSASCIYGIGGEVKAF